MHEVYRMNIFHAPYQNFGDAIVPAFWENVMPEVFSARPNETLLSIGTILNMQIPAKAQKVVFGSAWHWGHKPVLDRTWTVFGVRDFTTADALRLQPQYAIGDPLYLLKAHPYERRDWGIVYMPHYTLLNIHPIDQLQRALAPNITVLDPTRSHLDSFNIIASAKLVITGAMHGAIAADANRVPWVTCFNSPAIFYGKWSAWFEMIDVDVDHLAPVRCSGFTLDSVVDRVKRSLDRKPTLSSDEIYEQMMGTLQERLKRLKEYLAEK